MEKNAVVLEPGVKYFTFLVKLIVTFGDYMMAPLSVKRRKLDHEARSNDGSESEDSSNGAPAPQPALKGTELFKHAPPKRTQDDNDAALYAGGLYKSSLFKLQVDELLREVQPNYEKRFAGVNDALRRLKSLIEGVEERSPLSVS